jgi:hypothetical protein
MATTIDPRVIGELASILEGINPFTNLNEFNFFTCRGFKKDSTSRCGNPPGTALERKQLADLLSEFQVMTNDIDTASLYDKMKRFITFTHCKRYHREDACKAFDEWEAQSKTAALASLPITPSRSATPHSDYLESLSGLSSMTSPSDVPDSSEYDEPALDFFIREKMESLKVTAAAQNTQAKTDYRRFDEVEAQRETFKRLGVVHLPEKEKEQDNVKIYKTIQSPPSPKRMSGGILYILEHTEISGIFKIGWSSTSADMRLKQARNCYTFETKVIYETEGGRFIGAFQAENIAHAILDHKRIYNFECPHCKGHHTEWFLVSREEACSVVKLAERWLKIPAYALQQGKYKLTPGADSILKIMLPFSIPKMNVLIDKIGSLDNVSGAFSDTTLAAAVRETSALNASYAAGDKSTPRVYVDTSHIDRGRTTSPSRRYNLRERSPMGGFGDKEVIHVIETEEIVERYETRSRATTPDGNYMVVTKHSNTIRKKVSRTSLEPDTGICDSSKSGFFDLKGKKQVGKEVF